METCLRVMNSQDTKAVMALEAACFSDPWTWGIIKDLPDSPWDETWLLEDERGTLLGYLTCRFLAGEGELMRIAVFPEFRGQGYSRELMDLYGIPELYDALPKLATEPTEIVGTVTKEASEITKGTRRRNSCCSRNDGYTSMPGWCGSNGRGGIYCRCRFLVYQ